MIIVHELQVIWMFSFRRTGTLVLEFNQFRQKKRLFSQWGVYIIHNNFKESWMLQFAFFPHCSLGRFCFSAWNFLLLILLSHVQCHVCCIFIMSFSSFISFSSFPHSCSLPKQTRKQPDSGKSPNREINVCYSSMPLFWVLLSASGAQYFYQFWAHSLWFSRPLRNAAFRSYFVLLCETFWLKFPCQGS